MAKPIPNRLNEHEAFDRGTAALNSGDPQSGLAVVEPFLKSGSHNYGLWQLHGLLLRASERHEEAIRSLEQAARLAPRSASIAHSLARTLYEAGLPSVEAYTRALQLAPGAPEALAGLSVALVSAGRRNEAVAGLEVSVARSPAWTEGHRLLARLRWAQGERESFTRSFDEALAQLPAHIELRSEQIDALLHAEQWDEVLRVVTNGRASMGDQPLFDLAEAIAWSEAGVASRADSIFEHLADLEHDRIQVRRVRHLLRTGHAEQASAVIEPWLSRPEAFMFWANASLAWRLTNDPRAGWLEGDERFVGIYDIADRLPPLDQLADRLRSLHSVQGQPLEQSLRGGSQTDGNLFLNVDPLIVQVKEAVRAVVVEHIAQLPPPDQRHPLLAPTRNMIRFSGAWSVRLTGGGFHANHVHSAGWISSALYVALPGEVGDGDAGVLTLGEPQAQLGLDLPPFRTVEPKPGRLALFPSYMWHGTRRFGEGERMTIAFDVARQM